MTSPYNLHGLEIPSVKPVTFCLLFPPGGVQSGGCRSAMRSRAQITPVLEKAWLRMEDLSCLTKGVSRLPQAPSRSIASIRIMSAESQHEAKKVGAVIYLATNRPLHLPDFLAEFHVSWPHLLLQKTGKEPHRALFRVGKSDFALELHHTPVHKRLRGPSLTPPCTGRRRASCLPDT